MFKMAKYLEINRSVDGVRGHSRWFQLPSSRQGRVVGVMNRASLSAEFIKDLRSSTRFAADPPHRATGRILF